MKMRSSRFIFSAIVAVALTACGAQTENKEEVKEVEVSEATEGTYLIDTEASTVTWEGNMLEIGGVSLYGHHGNVKIAKGEIIAEGGQITNGTIVVDMTSIDPKDDNYQDKDGGRASDLVGHLSSDDFFAVEQYPTSTFQISASKEGKIVGKMNIRGIEKEVVIDEITIDNSAEDELHAKGTFSFDRQEFDVKFSMPVQEKVLSDKITMGFDVKAKKTA